MSFQTPLVKEPLHLMLVRCLLYSALVVVAITPMTTWAASWAGLSTALASLPAAIAALILSRRLAVSRVRTLSLLLGVVVVIVAGVFVERVVGGASWLARALGGPSTLILTDALTFALVSFGVVLGLRVLALRFSTLAILEVLVAAVAVASLFATHRDLQISQPRPLADWAFSHGFDPFDILRGVGVLTLFGLLLLLLPRQRLARTAAALAMLLLLLGVMAALILVGHVPWAGGGNGAEGKNSESKSGKPEHDMDFKDRKEGGGGPRPIAMVVLHDDFHPADGAFHLRDDAFSQLLANRLVATTVANANRDLPTDYPTEKAAIEGAEFAPAQTQTVRTSVCLLEPLKKPMVLVTGVGMEPRPNTAPGRFKQVYGVTSQGLATRKIAGKDHHPYQTLIDLPADNPEWSSALRAQYLACPADERYHQHLDRIVADAIKQGRVSEEKARSPLVKGLLCMDWIRENTTYTLRPGNGGMPDPAADFLFGSRLGYCQHVASAMAFLLRSEGIPTRVAVGFAVDEKRVGDKTSFLIQDTDGHAWCEIYLHGAGWIPLDGSPGRSIDPPFAEPSAGLNSLLREEFSKPKVKDQQPEQEPDWAWLWLLLKGMGVVAGGGLAMLYGIKIWLRMAPGLASAPALYRVCYRATLNRLAEVGLVRRFGETREEFARRVSEKVPELQALTGGHMRCAVGGREDLERADWRQREALVRQRLNREFSRTRRWLGMLNPVSWMYAR
jgi:protein-glutamine gamma-glutamyltransferase